MTSTSRRSSQSTTGSPGSRTLQRRLLALRLQARRADRREAARPAACASCSRAGTRRARAARSAGSPVRSIRVTSGSSSFAAPSEREKRHHFLWRFWPVLPGMGRDGRARPLVVRPGARRAGRGLRDRARVAARLRRDRRLRAHARRGGDGAGQVLDAHLRGRAVAALPGARARPAQALEADRRGLAQSRPPCVVRACRRGHAAVAPITSSRRGG